MSRPRACTQSFAVLEVILCQPLLQEVAYLRKRVEELEQKYLEAKLEVFLALCLRFMPTTLLFTVHAQLCTLLFNPCRQSRQRIGLLALKLAISGRTSRPTFLQSWHLFLLLKWQDVIRLEKDM